MTVAPSGDNRSGKLGTNNKSIECWRGRACRRGVQFSRSSQHLDLVDGQQRAGQGLCSLNGDTLCLTVSHDVYEVLLHYNAAVNQLLVDGSNSGNERVTIEIINSKTPKLSTSILTKWRMMR